MRQQQVICELAVDRDCGNNIEQSISYGRQEIVEDNGNERQPCTLTEENLSKVKF